MSDFKDCDECIKDAHSLFNASYPGLEVIYAWAKDFHGKIKHRNEENNMIDFKYVDRIAEVEQKLTQEIQLLRNDLLDNFIKPIFEILAKQGLVILEKLPTFEILPSDSVPRPEVLDNE